MLTVALCCRELSIAPCSCWALLSCNPIVLLACINFITDVSCITTNALEGHKRVAYAFVFRSSLNFLQAGLFAFTLAMVVFLTSIKVIHITCKT